MYRMYLGDYVNLEELKNTDLGVLDKWKKKKYV